MFEQYRETNQRKMNVPKHQFRNFEISAERYHFRLWVFAFDSQCFYCWHWKVLPKVLQCKWCKIPFRSSIAMAVSFYASTLQICCLLELLPNLTGTFQNQVAELSAVYCRIWLKGSQIIHMCHILRVNELSQTKIAN